MNELSGGLADRPVIATQRAKPRTPSPRGLSDLLSLPYLRSVLRRRFWIAFPFAAVFSTLGLLVAFVLPPTYQSSATILVEGQQIPSELARSTVTASAVEQIQVVEQRLMTRATLLRLADKHNIFANRPLLSPTERVERMRRAIDVRLLNFGSGSYGQDISTAVAFVVSFTAEDPRVAAAVVSELLTLILEQNTELRRARAESTSNFFQQEVDRLARELGDLEAEMLRFQQENESALPDNLAFRRNQLDLIEQRLQNFELQRLDLEQRQALTRLTMEEQAVTGGVSATEAELATLRRTLVQRQAVLSPSHPEVRALASSIAALEAAMAGVTPAAEDGSGPAAVLEAQIARRARLFDEQIAFIDAQIETLTRQREELERSILDTPAVEIRIASLERAHEDIERQYESSKDKLSQAIIGERLEDRRQAERFEVIEQPVAAEEPVSPNRLKIAGAGVVLGFGSGLGVVLLLELLSSVIRRPEDFSVIDMQPLAVLPYIDARGERLRRWGLRIVVVGVIFGGSSAALWAVHTQYLPLEVLTQRAAEKAGLAEPIDLMRRRFGL